MHVLVLLRQLPARAWQHPAEQVGMDEAWRQPRPKRARAIWQREGKPAGSPDQFNPITKQELLAEGRNIFSIPMDQRPRTEAMDTKEAGQARLLLPRD